MNIFLKLSFVILFLSFSSPLLSMEQVDNIPAGRYVIKSRSCGKYICCDGEAAKCKSSLDRDSVVTFEKTSEGFLIRNYYNNKCFKSPFGANEGSAGSCWSNSITSDCYFYIFKKDGAYVIKSTKFSDYLNTNANESTSLWLKTRIDNGYGSNAYFLFEKFEFSF